MTELLKYKGYQARIVFDAEDEIFVGRVLGINDIVGFHSDTASGLKSAFAEAVDDYLAVCKTAGKSPEKAFSGNLMLRVAPEVHSKAAIAAKSAGKSLNQWGEDVLRSAADKQIG